MVLDDVPQSKQAAIAQPSSEKTLLLASGESAWLASPLDRLAAQIADSVVFFPILELILAPFMRMGREADLTGDEFGLRMSVVASCAVTLGALVLYQWVFLIAWGTTPGKRVLGLRVVHQRRRDRLSPFASFMRAVFFVGEALLLGVPWLSAVSNPRRQPWHDRIAESIVVTTRKNRQASLTHLHERSIVRSLQISLALFLSFMLIQAFWPSWRAGFKDEQRFVKSEELDGYLCREVREEMENVSGSDPLRTDDRLQMALSLFVIGDLSSDCLDAEADHALRKGQGAIHTRSLAYLAKGLVAAGESGTHAVADTSANVRSRADEYFAHACHRGIISEKDNCLMVDLFKARQDSEKEGQADSLNLDHLLATVEAQQPTFIRLQALKSINETGDFRRALAALELVENGNDSFFEGSRKVGQYLAEIRIKSLWSIGSGREARQSLLALQDVIEPGERVELSRWLCSQEISGRGCNIAEASDCSVFRRSVSSSDSWLANPEVAAVFARTIACQKTHGLEDLRLLKIRMPTEEGRQYLEGIDLLASGKRAKGLTILNSLLNSPSLTHGLFYLEAARTLIDQSHSRTEMRSAMKLFSQMDGTEDNRTLLGLALMRRLNELNDYEQSFKIAMTLDQSGFESEDIVREIALAAEGSGHHNMAAGLVESLTLKAEPPEAPRNSSAGSPASLVRLPAGGGEP